MSQPLWTPAPEQAAQTNMMRFMVDVNQAHHLALNDYDSLYDWSVSNMPAFWEAVWRFADIIHSVPHTSVLEHPVMPGATWFQGARLNFAENLLRYWDDRPALVFVQEGGLAVAALTYRELYGQVARTAHFLRVAGVQAGDRVAGFIVEGDEAGSGGAAQDGERAFSAPGCRHSEEGVGTRSFRTVDHWS